MKTRFRRVFPFLALLAATPAIAQEPAAGNEKRMRVRAIHEDYEKAWKALDWKTEAARRKSGESFLEAGRRRELRIREEAGRRGIPLRLKSDPDGEWMELHTIEEDGTPRYTCTANQRAQITTATHQVQGSGISGLGGRGWNIGIWEAADGIVRTTHEAFNQPGGSSVLVIESMGSPTNFTDHATHVGGTLAGFGTSSKPQTRGMVPYARLLSANSGNDHAEVAVYAALDGINLADRITISNHSYCMGHGFTVSNGKWYWLGGKDYREDPGFGRYGSYEQISDEACRAFEYYLPFRAAGNNRDDAAPPAGTSFYLSSDLAPVPYSPSIHPLPPGAAGGWDTIAGFSNGKNCMTVGAVTDAVGSGGARDLSQVTMSSFSGWGPADDGRIKPDIVACGVHVYSPGVAGDDDYQYKDGTSMATPNASGSALLLQEYHHSLHGTAMKAATLKALILHTADDLGNPGPDYKYGWGLMNTKVARDMIQLDFASSEPLIIEDVLTDGGAKTYTIYATGAPVKGTLCWTDPAGTARQGLDDASATLVNNLDLTLEQGGTVHRPWVLDPAAPSANATRGINSRDNVEQVLATPSAGVWTVRVAHSGALAGGSQKFSLILSGHATGSGPPGIQLLNTVLSSEGSTGMDAPSVEFSVRNSGGGSLAWSVESDVPWLAPSPASGESSGEFDAVQLRFASGALAAGTHIGAVRVRSPGLVDRIVTVILTQVPQTPVPIEVALDSPGVEWMSGVPGDWAGFSGIGWDGEDCVRLTQPSSSARLSATITGPARIRWRWLNAGNPANPASQHNMFMGLNGGPALYSAPTDAWEQREQLLPAGPQTVQFWAGGFGTFSTPAYYLLDDVEIEYPPRIPEQTIYGFAGQAVQYQLKADGAAADWTASPNMPAGLSLSPTGLVTGSYATPGTLSRNVSATSPGGLTGQGQIQIVIQPAGSLGVALDNSQIDPAGANPWFAQSLITHDGVDAARSQSIGNSAESRMDFTVTGPVGLVWWWKVSSEPALDRLRVFLDNVEVDAISGEVDWTRKILTVDRAGSHSVSFRYTKNAAGSAGLDAGFVDQVQFFAPPEFEFYRSRDYLAPAAVTGVPYRWLVPFAGEEMSFSAAGLPSPLVIDPATGVISGVPAAAGTHQVDIAASNPGGTTTQPVTLEIAPPIPLEVAVESSGVLTWTSGGTFGMVGIPGDIFHGRDAARSGPITHGQQSWMQTTLTGPALVTYIWQCSSEANYDKLKCLLDGIEQAAVSGEMESETRTLTIPAGSHTLRFSYDKDGSVSSRLDVGWVERVAVLYPPAFSSPADVTGWAGQDIVHQVAADPADTVGCTALPSGLVFNPLTRILSGVAASPGSYTPVVTATNAGGSSQQTLNLTVLPVIALPAALDYPLISSWTTTSSAPWFGQSSDSDDGADAARAGILLPGEYQTSMSASVAGPARLTWKWKVRSTPGRDRLVAQLDGLEVSSISGESGWVDGAMILPAGNHTVAFTYLKSGDDFVAGEGAWVDQFNRQIPPAVLGGISNGTVGLPYTASVPWVQGAPTAYFAAGLPPGLALNTATGAVTGTPTHPGVYPVGYVASNAAGSSTAITTITVVSSISLPVALDTPLNWVLRGPAWFGQASTSRDRTDAARSGLVRGPLDLGGPEESVMETTVAGPGHFSCYVRTDSEPGGGLLRVFLDETIKHSLSGPSTPWTRVIFSVPPGSHKVAFSYSKGTNLTVGQDAAWVDQVEWITTGFHSLVSVGGNFQVTFGTATGWSFQLQTSPDLVNWTSIGRPVSGTGLPVNATFPAGAVSPLYWRVLETPVP